MLGKSRTFEIASSAERTATVTFNLNGLLGDWDEVVAYLDVTASSGTSPTLDVSIENTVDGGTVYYPHTSLTQATATTTERKNIPSPFGIDGRVNCVIGGTTPSFTFSLRLECKRNS